MGGNLNASYKKNTKVKYLILLLEMIWIILLRLNCLMLEMSIDPNINVSYTIIGRT